MTHQMTCWSAGGDPGRALQRDLTPPAEPRRDWLHRTMRRTGLPQTATGVSETTRAEEEPSAWRDPVVRELERLPWVLWHGNVDQARQVGPSVERDLDAAVANSGHATARTRLNAVAAYHTSIAHHPGFIPTDGTRSRAEERIRTGCGESTVTQGLSTRVGKRQQMPWTPQGAPLLL